jgi:hypothetical protein
MNWGTRDYYKLLFILSTSLILILSGCTQPLQNEPKQEPKEEILFDLTTASFYNPMTNTSDRIYVRNLNYSGSVFHHNDQMEISVGLRDGKGRPGIAINITMRVIYTWIDKTTTQAKNLTQTLGIRLTTNTSGLAHLTFTYNQYSWPKSSLSAWGYLEITSPNLNNTKGTSQGFSFSYYRKIVVRNTTQVGGITAIEKLENSSLIEEAGRIEGTGNSYVSLTNIDDYVLRGTIINKTTIDYFTEYTGGPRIEITYYAWAIPIQDTNLTYLTIKNTWRTYIDPRFGGIYEEELDPSWSWRTTSPLSEVNFTNGWLICQEIMIDVFTYALDAWGVTVYQISLLTLDLELQWLISSSSGWIS